MPGVEHPKKQQTVLDGLHRNGLRGVTDKGFS